jgi:hypothetical protein
MTEAAGLVTKREGKSYTYTRRGLLGVNPSTAHPVGPAQFVHCPDGLGLKLTEAEQTIEPLPSALSS